jgi:hypothetical protein
VLGIPSRVKDSINEIVENMFDRIAIDLVGEIPKLRHKKLLIISSKRNYGLPNLFIQAMNNRSPNYLEEDALRGLLDSSHNYIEALKNRTKSAVIDRIDGLAREAKANKRVASEQECQAVIDEEMEKAKSQLNTIIEAEATKFRNFGSMMDISRVASNVGDTDPSVFFVVVRDGATCEECIKLHLTPDGTPRVWKFSQLKQSYHKRGENAPSSFGLHPRCRCTLTYLSPGFGFKDGKLAFISQNHDQFLSQKE